jgi:hypothetical protein
MTQDARAATNAGLAVGLTIVARLLLDAKLQEQRADGAS